VGFEQDPPRDIHYRIDKTSRMRTSLLLLLIAGVARLPAAPAIPLVEAGRSVCAIVYPKDCALSERTARKLSACLREQTGAEISLVSGSGIEKSYSALIVLDGTAGHELARAVSPAQPSASVTQVAGERAESYRLATVSKPGGQAVILALGKSPAGAKYAVYRLMREIEVTKGGAHLRELDVSAEPFIKTRSVALFNVWGHAH
jgi:hypothetical protein